MNHPRSIIRNAIIDRLKSRVIDAGGRVYGNRAKPLFDQFLPAILVYTTSETILEDRFNSDGFGAVKRELDLAIEAVVKGENIDEQLDKFACQIENALEEFEIPSRLADILRLKSTESDISVEGSNIYGAIRLNYNLIYFTKNKS